ncbi:aspartate--tRNA ligase [Oribacterium sp. oral taxon 102]|uniref:aspartate--tRNA ligase n=1 Tax=Oribacterium sp. oral taxon 102 TaxID=671214 RepID=UPI0015BB8A1A|nr:aspartate--tRNA ligase [Oribacterium sp. oral taxon 102]NWO21162.1 aspartate--tRNA ligase [Oribacterium sp. oral taxon 102]
MAESMQGLHRTARCAEINESYIGKAVTVMGWVQKSRNKGGLIFTDLRDRSGILQILFEEADCGTEVFEKAARLRSEFVIAVTGTVRSRGKDANAELATGSIEVSARELRILSESEVPPFPIENGIKTKEEIRLKYRYLDLRRPELAKRIMTRARIAFLIRQFMTENGFLEIETPTLIKSTPEGARDFLVPSRMHHGSFYALPQSPQLLKQLLMVSGMDRYFQLARCYRDEDLRADRQPEFTQVDMELSFVDVEDVIELNERLLRYLFREVCGVELTLPIPRMRWIDAMNRYGSDKPDMRFELPLLDVSEAVRDCGFSVFSGCVQAGGYVKGLCVKGQAGMPRKQIDAYTELVRGYGAKGLAYLTLNADGSRKSSFAKFLSEEELSRLIAAANAEPGDLLLFVSDTERATVWNALGALRIELGKNLGLIDRSAWKFLWVTEFPMFEWSEELGRFQAMHHPFTMPMDEDLGLLDSNQGAVRAKAYDIVLNGTELGGGSVRIHQAEVQEKMLEKLGFTPEKANEQFGFLMQAFKYGVPPHAGLAYGLDRLAMWMVGSDTIRDVIAFPKIKDGSDPMMDAPAPVFDEQQLSDLGIAVLGEENSEQ